MKRARSLIVAVAMLAAAAGKASAASDAQVTFSPQEITAGVDDAIAVDVTVANLDPSPGLAAYDLMLTFDPRVVRLDSFADAGFVTSGQNIVICVTGQIDNAAGNVNATCTAIPVVGAPGVSTTEPVALLHASFTTSTPGTSALTLAGSLSGPDGTRIAAIFQRGTIHVTQATAGPSPGMTGPAAPSLGSTPGARRVPATGSGGGYRESPRSLTLALAAGTAVAIAIAGSLLIGRRRPSKHGP